MELGWIWLLGDSINNGLHTVLLGMKRHKSSQLVLCSIILKISQNHIVEFFREILKSSLPDPQDYMFYFNILFDCIFDQNDKELENLLVENGLIQEWIEIALQFTENES